MRNELLSCDVAAGRFDDGKTVKKDSDGTERSLYDQRHQSSRICSRQGLWAEGYIVDDQQDTQPKKRIEPKGPQRPQSDIQPVSCRTRTSCSRNRYAKRRKEPLKPLRLRKISGGMLRKVEQSQSRVKALQGKQTTLIGRGRPAKHTHCSRL